MSKEMVQATVRRQRDFFSTGKTRDCEFRKEQLRVLKRAIHEHENDILEALHKDLHKPSAEAYLSEVGFLYEEIGFTLKNLRSWMKPQKVATPLLQFIGSSRIYAEPLGVVLIMGPFNYPFQLLMAPLVGAISGGNCSILKPSELAPHTADAVETLIAKAFDPGFVTVMRGGRDVSTAVLDEKFDHIFFTGGPLVGKVVLAAAVKHLTPVTLELGGKSPCIIDKDTDLEATARRVTWGKFFNAGQTCVAPDYVLVPSSIKREFLERMKHYVEKFFGSNPAESADYGRIINEKHFQRLQGLMDQEKTVFGGETRPESLYIAPTALSDIPPDHKSMEDEIFGPILPVLPYEKLEDAIRFVNERPKPLALYVFSNDRAAQRAVVEQTSFGGGCVNDTLVHLGNPRMPFGGVGDSGMGNYHGKYSFETFSHRKSVMRRSFMVDPMFRYPPYGDRLRLFKRFIR